MAPEVFAAWIAAAAATAAAVLGGIVSWRVSALSGQVQAATTARTVEAQLVVAALEHLVGRSQERAAGLAALRVLKSTTEKKQWDGYEKAVKDLLITQLQYVLTRGTNRWEAHEVQNVHVMASWFLQGNRLSCGSDQPQIDAAVKRYRTDWGKAGRDGTDYGDDGGRANKVAVDNLITKLVGWCNIP